MTRLVAVVPLLVGRERIAAGQEFVIDAGSAAVLVARNQARHIEAPKATKPEPKPGA